MTWWRQGADYGIYFNRDEQKTRQRAEPPFIWPDGFLAPRDPQGAGTWIAVNPSGLILALLNRWHEGAGGTQSRGLLIPDLARHREVGELSEALPALSLERYSPFTLVAMDTREILRWDWTGSELLQQIASPPITSSSYRFEEVRAERQRVFQELGPERDLPAALAGYHERATGGAHAVRMLRPDAQTWSRSRVTVSPTEIYWDYQEEFSNFEAPAQNWTSQLNRTEASF